MRWGLVVGAAVAMLVCPPIGILVMALLAPSFGWLGAWLGVGLGFWISGHLLRGQDGNNSSLLLWACVAALLYAGTLSRMWHFAKYAPSPHQTSRVDPAGMFADAPMRPSATVEDCRKANGVLSQGPWSLRAIYAACTWANADGQSDLDRAKGECFLRRVYEPPSDTGFQELMKQCAAEAAEAYPPVNPFDQFDSHPPPTIPPPPQLPSGCDWDDGFRPGLFDHVVDAAAYAAKVGDQAARCAAAKEFGEIAEAFAARPENADLSDHERRAGFQKAIIDVDNETGQSLSPTELLRQARLRFPPPSLEPVTPAVEVSESLVLPAEGSRPEMVIHNPRPSLIAEVERINRASQSSSECDRAWETAVASIPEDVGIDRSAILARHYTLERDACKARAAE